MSGLSQANLFRLSLLLALLLCNFNQISMLICILNVGRFFGCHPNLGYASLVEPVASTKVDYTYTIKVGGSNWIHKYLSWGIIYTAIDDSDRIFLEVTSRRSTGMKAE